LKSRPKRLKHIIIDGHLAFALQGGEFENVMTENDKRFYTDFIYWELPVKEILERQQNDKNKKREYTYKTIQDWIAYERRELEMVCEKAGIHLHYMNALSFQDGINYILNILKM
jgi:hypothetical protein